MAPFLKLVIAIQLLGWCLGQRCHKQSNETCLEDDKCEWDGSICYLGYKEIGFGECVGAKSAIPDKYVSDKKLTTLHEGQCEYTCNIIKGCIGVGVEANSSATTCILYVDGELQNQPHGFSTYVKALDGSIPTIETSNDTLQDSQEWLCKARLCDNTDCGCDISSPECGDPEGIKGQCGCIEHLDECTLSPCGDDQYCVDQSTLLESQDDFICTCNNSNHFAVGKAIPVCIIDECSLRACHQGQTCVDPNVTSASVGDFICYCNTDNETFSVGGPVPSCGVAFLDECEPSPCFHGQSCIDPNERYLSSGDYICTCDNGAGSFVGGSFEDCEELITEPGNDCAGTVCGPDHYCVDTNSTSLGDYICICKTNPSIVSINTIGTLCPLTPVPTTIIQTDIPSTDIPETNVPHERGVAYISNDVFFVKQQLQDAGLYLNDSYIGGVGAVVLVAKNRILVEFSEGEEYWVPTAIVSLFPWTAVPVIATSVPTGVPVTEVRITPSPTEVVSDSGEGLNIFLFLFIGLAVVLIIVIVVVCCRYRLSQNATSGQEPLVSSYKITGIHELTEMEGIPMITSTPHPLMASTPKFGFDAPDSPSRVISHASF